MQPFVTSWLLTELFTGIRCTIVCLLEAHPREAIVKCVDYLYGHCFLGEMLSSRIFCKQKYLVCVAIFQTRPNRLGRFVPLVAIAASALRYLHKKDHAMWSIRQYFNMRPVFILESLNRLCTVMFGRFPEKSRAAFRSRRRLMCDLNFSTVCASITR